MNQGRILFFSIAAAILCAVGCRQAPQPETGLSNDLARANGIQRIEGPPDPTSDSEPKSAAPKPCIYVLRIEEVTDQFQSLEFAVWKDGRVVWRDRPADPDPSAVMERGKWGWKLGKYFEFQVEPHEVADILSELKNDVGPIGDWYGIWPARSDRFLVANDGSFSLLTGSNPRNQEFRLRIRAWEILQRCKKTLTRGKGKEIAPFSTADWL